MSYNKKEQLYMIVAASLFLIGAIFMLINTFGGIQWTLWAGIGFAIAATIAYILVTLMNARFNKKYTVSERERIAAEQKNASSLPAQTSQAQEDQAPAPTNEPETTADKPAVQATKPQKPATKTSTKTTTKKQQPK